MKRGRNKTAFTNHNDGSASIMFALTLIALMGFIGAAVDGARWFTARSQHAASIDAALLAGAKYMQSNPTDQAGAVNAAASYYQMNLPDSVGISNASITFNIEDSGATLTYSGNASLPTTFLAVVGIKSLPVNVPAKAVVGDRGSNLEIALMLDMTGSMCDDGTGPCTSGSKIDGVRQAAGTLADIVLGSTSLNTTKRIALVPFSQEVRIDEDGSSNPMMQALTDQPPTWSGWQANWTCTNSGTGYMKGEVWVETSPSSGCSVQPVYQSNLKLIPCVTERTFQNGVGFDPSDSAPGRANWLLGNGGDRFPNYWDSSDSVPFIVGTSTAPGYSGQTASDPTGQWDYSTDGSGCQLPPGNEILPLTSDLSAVSSRLKSLSAYGATAGALGVSWTQYMLSPNWSSVWGGSSAPGSYADTQATNASGAPKLRKIAVLMTDGGFNTFREAVTDFSQDGGTWMQNVSNYAISACTNMKKNGIEIYTVGFNLNALPPGEQSIATATLQACGTDISHFYNSIDATQLNNAFADIGLKMNPVRLTQ